MEESGIQNSGARIKTDQRPLAKDLPYGDISQLNLQLEEVSKLPEAYSAKFLTSGF
jgi:hypothetical protein